MRDLIQEGADWLEGQRKAFLSRTVTYARGEDTVEVAATVGRTQFESSDEYGITLQGQVRDYILAAADLLLNDETVLPHRGDTISETIGGVLYTFEVMDLGGEQCYQFCDPSGRTLRVHTKATKVETP